MTPRAFIMRYLQDEYTRRIYADFFAKLPPQLAGIGSPNLIRCPSGVRRLNSLEVVSRQKAPALGTIAEVTPKSQHVNIERRGFLQFIAVLYF